MFSFKEAAKIVALMNADERRQFNRLGEKLLAVRGSSWLATIQHNYYLWRIDCLLNSVVDRFITGR